MHVLNSVGAYSLLKYIAYIRVGQLSNKLYFKLNWFDFFNQNCAFNFKLRFLLSFEIYCHFLSTEPLESIPHIDGVVDTGVADTEVTSDDLEMDYAGKLSNITNVPRQPDYLLGLATGQYGEDVDDDSVGSTKDYLAKI